MKKYLILVVLFAIFLNSYAEMQESKRRSANPNYKKLKVYAKVWHRYGNSNYYQMQVDILNTGNTSVSFWEDMPSHVWTCGFTAGGIVPATKEEVECFLKKKPYPRTFKEKFRSVRINPHCKYTFKFEFAIGNRATFLNSNKNLRLIFHYEDANLAWQEDPNRPILYSENTIKYDW